MRSEAPSPPCQVRLDLANERLWVGGNDVPLTPKAFAMLSYMVANPGRLLTKDKLLQAVWSGVCVTDSQVKQVVQQLRRTLGDDPRTPLFIETVHGRGYRFVGQLQLTGSDGPGPSVANLPAKSETFVQAPGLAGLVGRNDELRELGRWLASALDGTPTLGFVVGEGGVGKTTLVSEFLRGAAGGEGLLVGFGQCSEYYGAGEPYMPVFEALEGVGRKAEGTWVKECLLRLAPSWLAQMPALLGEDEREQLRALGSVRRERAMRELTGALQALTAVRPLVLWLEDIHWADDSTLELLAYLGDRKQSARLLMIGTCRAEEARQQAGVLARVMFDLRRRGACRELPLGPLDRSAVSAYVEARLPGLPPFFAHRLYQRTEGHPLFVAHLLDHLVAREGVARVGQGWVLGKAWAEVEVGIPSSLQELIEWGLARLPPEDQRLLEDCSVAGFEFCAGNLAEATGRETAQTEERCEGLVRQQAFLRRLDDLKQPDGTVAARYAFLHNLYLQVLYDRVTPIRRAALHRAIGETLERAYAGRSDEVAAELALHFERAGDLPRAVRRLGEAARRALSCHANSEAVALMTRALGILQSFPDSRERAQQELVLQAGIGSALTTLKGMGAPEAGEAFVQAAELARRAGSEAQLFAVLCGLYGFHIMRAECDMARTVGDEMLEMAVHSGIASQRLMAHTVAGVTTHFAGNFLQAREIFSLAMTFYQREERQATVSGTELCPEMYCVASDAHALWFLGYPDQALARAGEAVALARRSPNPFNVAEALRYQKYLHQLRGEVEQARSVAEGALALAKKYDLPYSSAGARFHRAWVRCMDGEQEQGVRQMRQALDAYRTDSSVLDQIAHLPLFAEACWRTRQTGEGLDAVASAMSLVRGSGAAYWEADLNRLQGELVLQQQGPNARQQAEPCFERALAIARDQQAKSLELRAATSLARLWRDQGRDADARRLLEPVFSRFNEGHSTRDLREAKGLLED